MKTMMLMAMAATLPNLEGTWARQQLTTAVSSVPILGEVTSETRALVLVRIEQEGRDLEIHEEVCRLETRALGGMVQTTYPEGFKESVSGRTKRGRLLYSPRGLGYEEIETAHPVGAVLDRPKEDPLPTSPRDPRVVDADGDGKPGVTVQVRGLIDGDLYMVHRSKSRLLGRVLDQERIAGRVTWKTEQSVLSATRDVLANPPKTQPHPDPARSKFRMRRVPADLDCQTLIAQGNRIF